MEPTVIQAMSFRGDPQIRLDLAQARRNRTLALLETSRENRLSEADHELGEATRIRRDLVREGAFTTPWSIRLLLIEALTEHAGVVSRRGGNPLGQAEEILKLQGPLATEMARRGI